MAIDHDIIVVKGDTARWTEFVYDSSGATVSYSGCTLYMQVRNGYYPADLVASYKLYVPPGTVLSYPKGLTGGISAWGTGGTLYLCIGSSQSNDLALDRTCKYDVKLQSSVLNDITTIIKGNIQVLPEVTDI